jgi:hypothetical protein
MTVNIFVQLLITSSFYFSPEATMNFNISLLLIFMPEVTRFYGIVIKIFFGDHPPPHFHAVYGEYNALVGIESLKIIEGDLPSRAEKMVIEWATLYQKELLNMWNSQEFSKLPPLK